MAWRVWMFSLALWTLTGCASVYGGDDATKKPESELSAEMTEKAGTKDMIPMPETERTEEGRESGEQDGDYVTEGTEKYWDDLIILAPQLEDWGETSARKTIALTEYFLEHYNIDRRQVYISGYSGGGETLSLVLDNRPELYRAALMCSSRWDGGYQAVVGAKTPVYFVTGESDEYYGSEPFERAYREICGLYEAEGLSETEIDNLVVLDIKPAACFTDRGVTNQHGGGAGLFSRDREIMGWLFGEHEPRHGKEG